MDEVLILAGDAAPQVGHLAAPICLSPVSAGLILAAAALLLVVAGWDLVASEGPRS